MNLNGVYTTKVSLNQTKHSKELKNDNSRATAGCHPFMRMTNMTLKKISLDKMSLPDSIVLLKFSPFRLCPRSLVSVATRATSLGLIRAAFQSF